jgi:hypothetical protein
MHHSSSLPDTLTGSRTERGSALLLAVFTLGLVGTAGLSLLFLTHSSTSMVRGDLSAKHAFYMAEAGQENGRMTLFGTNGTDAFDDDLATAAGANGTLDLDPAALRPLRDASGEIVGFTGFGDDAPLRATTSLNDGWFAAFLTNDPAEAGSLVDGNDRVLVTGVGAGRGNALEVVQALLVREYIPPLLPPALFTIVGPDPIFDGGPSNDKLYRGDDCSDPDVEVPVVGVIGSAGETAAEAGVVKPETYVSGSETGLDTVDDIASAIEPSWLDCSYLHDLTARVRDVAQVSGNTSTPTSDLGTPSSPKTAYIEGDYDISGSFAGGGLLWVTGELRMDGRASWYGAIYVVGQGLLLRDGGGSGFTEGAVFLANIAGPDGTMWTADDCSGEDGLTGTADDGYGSGGYTNTGGGTHGSRYCIDAIRNTSPQEPYRVASFIQH